MGILDSLAVAYVTAKQRLICALTGWLQLCRVRHASAGPPLSPVSLSLSLCIKTGCPCRTRGGSEGAMEQMRLDLIDKCQTEAEPLLLWVCRVYTT